MGTTAFLGCDFHLGQLPGESQDLAQLIHRRQQVPVCVGFTGTISWANRVAQVKPFWYEQVNRSWAKSWDSPGGLAQLQRNPATGARAPGQTTLPKLDPSPSGRLPEGSGMQVIDMQRLLLRLSTDVHLYVHFRSREGLIDGFRTRQ
jgi:hypothetical protein